MAYARAMMSVAEQDALAAIGEKDRADLLRAWCAINSGSRHGAGLLRMAAALEAAFAGLPARAERVELAPEQIVARDGMVREEPLGPALRFVVRPDAPLQAAFTGHYDTVYGADHAFQGVRVIDADHWNAPGGADMKGGLLVLLTALEAVERSPFAAQLGYQILLSPDEEIGSPGSGPLLAELGARADFALTYEPAQSDGALIDLRKGSGNFALRIEGRAAHAGRNPEEGRNAIAAAAALALALEALNGAAPGLSVNVAAIDGGGPLNVVPEMAVLRFNARAAQDADFARLEAELALAIATIERAREVKISRFGGVTRPAKPQTPGLRAMAAAVAGVAAELGAPVDFRASGGVCEGNNLAAAGCPVIDTMGVVGGAIHSPEEWVRLSSLAERARLSALFLMRAAQGKVDCREWRSRPKAHAPC